MAEYIDRKAAVAALFGDETVHIPTLLFAQKRIEAIPAADVVEVRHGHYVGEYDGYADGSPVYDMWYCSECGCYFEEWDEKPTYNYCPNCGAKMEGDKE